jgi:ribosomal protein S18 acetylase RimI-like enzyme
MDAEDLVRAKRPARLPVVLSRGEVRAVLAELHDDVHVMVTLSLSFATSLTSTTTLPKPRRRLGRASQPITRDATWQRCGATLVGPLVVGRPARRGGCSMRTDDARRTIRELQHADEADVVDVWHRSGRATYTFLPSWQAFTLEQARGVFESIIRPRCVIWVATLDQRIVAYLAMHGTYIDRLYVDPREWRKGWGTELVNCAKQRSPSGLELHTHQANVAARALYERHGFRAIKFGLSPAPESAPDVEYQWRPA